MKIKKISLRNLNDEVLSANYGSGLVSPGACGYGGYDGENMDLVVQIHSYV